MSKNEYQYDSGRKYTSPICFQFLYLVSKEAHHLIVKNVKYWSNQIF